jgi:phosphate/sulfate permease
MFSPMMSVLLLPFLAAMFLAINMGASGTAPAFSAAYGARLISRERIAGLFGIFVFAGAVVAGKKVVLTIGRGILPEDVVGIALSTIILVSVGVSLLTANLLRVPQSTSQATVAALVGPAAYFGVLKTDKLLLEIIPMWLLLPVVSFGLTLMIGKLLYARSGARRSSWLAGTASRRAVRAAVILASCYVAFAIGSNNVANAAGPIVAMSLNELGQASLEGSFTLMMILATLMVAPCFAIGSSLLGSRVVKTTGREIVEFGPLGGTLVALVTATLLLFASVSRGIPTSLVQMNTAAIMALGVVKEGWEPIARRTSVRRLLTVWIVAPLMSLGISLAATAIADRAGLL